MKNWDTIQADKNLILSKNFTRGRGGQKIQFIVIHHNAGNLSAEEIYQTWQTRPASAHYQVASDGLISQHVWDKDTAHHAGNLLANRRSIGIEHANDNTKTWSIAPKALEEGAHLVAALCKFYKLGRPQWGKNVYPHSNFSPTLCPGQLGKSQNALYMARAQFWYDQMTGAKPAVQAKPASAVKPKAPTYPLPPGYFYGFRNGGIKSVSGTVYNAGVASDLAKDAKGRFYSKGLKAWQVQMQKRGWAITADGWYGNQTHNVVRKFQRTAGLTVDNYLGPKTWSAAWEK